ncbi:MAG TPA: Flp pilus assembly protein CpaB [Candidatus Eisenbacteria bacterium]|nr:Flp pilus assembly protein CpaB [Candidatus Eisenbacteria bacterium]
MRRSSRFVLLLGAFLAVLTFVVVLLIGGGGGGTAPEATPPTEVATVVATADIPLGEVVTAVMLETRELPVAARDADAFGDVSQAIGKVARKPIAAGAQIHASDFATATVQLSVPAGKRAFALEVNEKTGVGKLIFPGDYVDVIITLGAPGQSGTIPVGSILNPNNPEPNTDLIPLAGLNTITVKAPLLLQEIQVIGTIDPPPPPTQGAQQGGASPAPAAPAGPALTGTKKLIVLAVTDAQAEALIFARTNNCGPALTEADCSAGIDFVLRSPEDKGTTEATTGVILQVILDQYGVLPPFVQADINAFVASQP